MTEQTGSRPKAPAQEPPPRQTGPLKWHWVSDIEPDYWVPGLIDGLIDRHSMWIMYGASGSGKTAVAVDVAGHVAAGLPWRGHKVQQGLVLYVAAENAHSTKRRLWAWQRAKGQTGPLPWVIVENFKRLDQEAVGLLVALVVAAGQESGAAPVLIVIDTLARTMNGEENSNTDMSRFVDLADSLRDVTGASILIVHHTGKDAAKGARGAYALKAATDHEWEVFREGEQENRGIKVTKQREGTEEGHVYGFKMKSHRIGENALGRHVTSPVAVEADPPLRGAGKLAEMAEVAKAYIRGQGGRVTKEELRDTLGQLSTGRPESERKALNRLIKANFRELPGGYIGLPLEGDRRPGQDNP